MVGTKKKKVISGNVLFGSSLLQPSEREPKGSSPPSPAAANEAHSVSFFFLMQRRLKPKGWTEEENRSGFVFLLAERDGIARNASRATSASTLIIALIGDLR